MLNHLFGLLLIGLGLQTPAIPPSILGDQTTTEQTTESGLDSAPSPEMGDKTPGSKSQLRLKEDIKKFTNVSTLKEGKIASRGAMLELKKANWDQFKTQIQTERQKAIETFKTQREAFQTRLNTIKDERKKTIVQNTDVRLSDVNTKRTQMMTDNLVKMDDVLTKLTTKVNTLKTEGVDTTTADSAISAAQVAVSSAKNAVTTQAGKEYIIGVTSENNLKTDVGRSISGLEKDLKTTSETMKTTRESVTKAVEAVALLVGKKEGQP